MPNLIIDDTLRAKLHGLQEPVKLLDETGRTLGCFVPEAEY